jgi:hypothetical protein
MTAGSILHSVLVQGRLAYAMRRAAAARNHELGLQIMTPSLLAARLAGGLLRAASRESIEIGIRAALSQRGLLEDITPISGLPGATRAVLRTLRNVWRAGFDLRAGPYAGQPRVQDLARIEDTVRLNLQPGERLLPDLCDLARAAVQVAPRLIGPLRIEGLHARIRSGDRSSMGCASSFKLNGTRPPSVMPVGSTVRHGMPPPRMERGAA